MKVKKFLKYLKRNGATYSRDAKGSHEKWIINGKSAMIPTGHTGKEMPIALVERVCRTLEIKFPHR